MIGGLPTGTGSRVRRTSLMSTVRKARSASVAGPRGHAERRRLARAERGADVAGGCGSAVTRGDAGRAGGVRVVRAAADLEPRSGHRRQVVQRLDEVRHELLLAHLPDLAV